MVNYIKKLDACYRGNVRKVIGATILNTLGESDSITPVLEEASQAITLSAQSKYAMPILIVSGSLDNGITDRQAMLPELPDTHHTHSGSEPKAYS